MTLLREVNVTRWHQASVGRTVLFARRGTIIRTKAETPVRIPE